MYSSNVFNYITSISTFILALSIMFTLYQLDKNNKILIVKNFFNSNNILDDIIELFLNNKDMKYLFDNIFLETPIPHNIHRNITKEYEISILIFSKFSNFLKLIDENQLDNDDDHSIIQILFSMMDIIMKSDIMINNWKLYKIQFKPILLIKFIQDKYGL